MTKGTMRRDLYPELYLVEETHWWHRHKRRIIHALISRYCPQPGRVLDVGCGAGKILEELRQLGWQAEGVDTVLTQTKKRGLMIKKADLQTQPLPFPANYFDLIICLDTLEHMADDKRLTTEMIRVTKKNGVMIISVPAYSWLFSYWDKMLGHFRRYNKSGLEKIIPGRCLFISYYFSYLLLPAVIIRSIKTVLGKKHKSDFLTNPLPAFTGWLVDLFGWVELLWLKRLTLPFGLSLVAVAQKK